MLRPFLTAKSVRAEPTPFRAYHIFWIAVGVVVLSTVFWKVRVVGTAVTLAVSVGGIVLHLARSLHHHVVARRHAFGHDCALLSLVSAGLIVLPLHPVDYPPVRLQECVDGWVVKVDNSFGCKD